MNKPRIKEIIENIEEILEIENKYFKYVLNIYYEYIKKKLENNEFNSYASENCIELFSCNFWLLEKNSKGLMTSDEIISEKVRLINLKEKSEENCSNLIQLLLTGLATKEGMLNYSNYEEYLSVDMLEISVVSLRNFNIKFAEDFLIFCKTHK